MRYLIYMGALLLAGCITAKPVALPSGEQGFAIDCGGPYEVSDCMNKAAEVCRGPYHIVDQSAASGGGAMMPAGNGAIFVPANERIMVVGCGK